MKIFIETKIKILLTKKSDHRSDMLLIIAANFTTHMSKTKLIISLIDTISNKNPSIGPGRSAQAKLLLKNPDEIINRPNNSITNKMILSVKKNTLLTTTCKLTTHRFG